MSCDCGYGAFKGNEESGACICSHRIRAKAVDDEGRGEKLQRKLIIQRAPRSIPFLDTATVLGCLRRHLVPEEKRTELALWDGLSSPPHQRLHTSVGQDGGEGGSL